MGLFPDGLISEIIMNELDAKIAALWNAGRLVREIAAEIGRSPAAVQERVRRMRARGIQLPPRQPKLVACRRPATHPPTPQERSQRQLDTAAIAAALARSRLRW